MAEGLLHAEGYGLVAHRAVDADFNAGLLGAPLEFLQIGRGSADGLAAGFCLCSICAKKEHGVAVCPDLPVRSPKVCPRQQYEKNI